MQQQQPKNEEKTIKKNIKSMKEQIKISIRFFLLKLICKQELRANVNIKVSLKKIGGISKKKKIRNWSFSSKQYLTNSLKLKRYICNSSIANFTHIRTPTPTPRLIKVQYAHAFDVLQLDSMFCIQFGRCNHFSIVLSLVWHATTSNIEM